MPCSWHGDFPIGTTLQFQIDVSQTGTTKEGLVDGLNAIADRGQNVIVKVVTDAENFENGKDVIWFGTEKPKAKGLVVERGETVKWFHSSLSGRLISAKDMGARSLQGVYAAAGGTAKAELESWALENQVALSWLEAPSLAQNLLAYFVRNGVGNVVIALFLLLVTAILSWFAAHAKSRAIKLLAGRMPRSIHLEDAAILTKTVASGFLIGWVGMLICAAARDGARQIFLVALPSLLLSVLALACLFLSAMLISQAVSPKTRHIALRMLPTRRFRQLSAGIRMATIVLALLVVPTTITSAHVFYQLSKEYALWQAMQKNVSISFSDLDVLESFSEEALGSYDHVIVVDRASDCFRAKGFLLSAASSGNVVFQDEGQLRAGLEKYGMMPCVLSVDSIAEMALGQAQKFGQEAVFYVAACVCILLTVALAGVVSAQLWARENQKRIFTLHTFGNAYAEIVREMVGKEACGALAAVAIGCVCSFFASRPGVAALLGTVILVLALYGIGSHLAYRICSKNAFQKTCHRNF